MPRNLRARCLPASACASFRLFTQNGPRWRQKWERHAQTAVGVGSAISDGCDQPRPRVTFSLMTTLHFPARRPRWASRLTDVARGRTEVQCQTAAVVAFAISAWAAASRAALCGVE